MNVYERIRELASRRKVSIAELERALNMSNGSISKWATSKPNSEPLQRVADYFNVSVDYLLGRDKKYWELTAKDEMKIQDQLEEMIEDLSTVGLFSKDGEELDDNTRELLIMSLENSLRIATQEAKRKFTPKKYRN